MPTGTTHGWRYPRKGAFDPGWGCPFSRGKSLESVSAERHWWPTLPEAGGRSASVPPQSLGSRALGGALSLHSTRHFRKCREKKKTKINPELTNPRKRLLTFWCIFSQSFIIQTQACIWNVYCVCMHTHICLHICEKMNHTLLCLAFFLTIAKTFPVLIQIKGDTSRTT